MARRWLVYAPNGFGLGHVVQQLALARQIKRLSPEEEFLFLTDCESTNIIWREGFPSIKLIAHHTVKYGMVDEDTALAVNRATVATTYAAYRPDVFIADSFPEGRSKELLGILPNASRCILVCREKTELSRSKEAFRFALQHYGLVVLPHLPGEVEFPAPRGVAVEASGYFLMRSREEVLPRAEARRLLGLPQEGFVVLVGFGGGGDLQFDNFVQVMRQQAERFPDWTFALSLGPLYRGRPPDTGDQNFVPFTYFPMVEVCSAFDAAVTALGPNTMAELMHNGIPTVYVPRPGMDDDHEARARRIHKRRAGWILNSTREERLNQIFDSLADPADRARVTANGHEMVQENGAERAAETILDWLARS